jgi:GNAT superfamily N-acetyltransferase
MYRVRPFHESDRAALTVLYRDCRHEASWLPRAAKAQSSFSRDTEGESLFVAVSESDRPEGFISVWEPDAFIHHLYVRSSARGRGVGGMLLDFLNGRIPKPWRLKCLRANAQASAFYLNRGWREVSSGEGDDGSFAVLENHAS